MHILFLSIKSKVHLNEKQQHRLTLHSNTFCNNSNKQTNYGRFGKQFTQEQWQRNVQAQQLLLQTASKLYSVRRSLSVSPTIRAVDSLLLLIRVCFLVFSRHADRVAIEERRSPICVAPRAPTLKDRVRCVEEVRRPPWRAGAAHGRKRICHGTLSSRDPFALSSRVNRPLLHPMPFVYKTWHPNAKRGVQSSRYYTEEILVTWMRTRSRWTRRNRPRSCVSSCNEWRLWPKRKKFVPGWDTDIWFLSGHPCGTPRRLPWKRPRINPMHPLRREKFSPICKWRPTRIWCR